MIDGNKMWYLSSLPWKGCPFKCSLVVLTSKGQDEAIRMFREFYANDSLTPDEISEVPFRKGTVIEEAEA